MAAGEREAELIAHSKRSRKILTDHGGKAYVLRGLSLEDQIDAEKPFSNRISFEADVMTLKSRLIEVIVFDNPEKFWLPESVKPVDENEKLLKADAEILSHDLDINDIIGTHLSLPELVEVIFAHFDATIPQGAQGKRRRGVRLTGEAYGNHFAQTNTATRSENSTPRFARAG